MDDAAAGLLKQAWQARRDNRLDEAKRHALGAIEIVREAGERVGLARGVRVLAEIERNLQQPEDALRHYEEAVAILREEGEPLLLAHTVRHLGDVHQEAGHTELAKPCYDEALALYRRQPQSPPLNLANAVRSLAILQYDGGADEEATKLWREAGDLYDATGIQAGVVESSLRLALLAYRAGDSADAREWLHKANQAAKTSGEPRLLARVRDVKAQVDNSSGE